MTRSVYGIQSPRLLLRCWAPEDADDLQAVLAQNRGHLSRFLPWAQEEPQTSDQKLALVLRFRAEFERGQDRVFGVFSGPQASASDRISAQHPNSPGGPSPERVARPDASASRPPTGTLLGGVGLHQRSNGVEALEIGYWIAAEHQGRGYIHEAVGALVRLGFETLGLQKLEIRCAVHNTASRRVAERLGFSLDGILRAQLLAADGPEQAWDAAVYSLLAAEFRAREHSFPPIRCLDATGRSLTPGF